MNSAAQTEPDCALLSKGGEGAGFLVVEQRSSTPLGPKIVYANEELGRLSGYDVSSLVGSPLGLIYDRSDLATLVGKLPLIAVRANHCFMDRVLLRNGETRLPCRWTIRPTNREGEPRGHFALTVRPLPHSDERVSDKGKNEAAVEAAASVKPGGSRSPERAAVAAAAESAGQDSSMSPSLPAAAGPTLREYEEARNESITLAAAGVAHDFKNALQAIKMNLELAALGEIDEGALGEHIAEAQLALDDAEMLARQMLAFTRGEAGRSGVIRIGSLLERAVRLGSAGSGIACRLFQNENLKCVEGDPIRLYQVLHNLVINARQAMPNGGTIDLVADNVDLEPGNPYTMPGGSYIVISVTDRGCGISSENLPKIFHSTYSTKAGGSGVGLASCLAIVRSHRGGIRVASQIGVGTEFLVFLPATDRNADEDPAWIKTAAAAPRRGVPTDSGQGRVLVVEDQQGVARSTLGMLKKLGYETIHAGDGEEALARFREHFDSLEPVDLVLLDMTLPGGLPGREVAAELRRIDPTARIVATSGYFEEGEARDLSGEFAAVLPKPYGMEGLSQALERAVSV